MKSDKIPYIIYAGTESLIRNIDECVNNPENSSAAKIGEHIACWCSVSTIWEFNRIENKHALYRGQDCMKKICESLREHGKNIINFEKKKNITVNKRRTKITSRRKSILYLWKENVKKVW